MKILLLTNLKNEESKEDIWIADILKKDGNIVDISWIDYDEKLDEEYDVFIKRNIWLSDNHNYEEILKYEEMANKLNNRLRCKNKKLINFNGKFDEQGKDYLVKLFNRGYEVIPSINKKEDINKFAETEKYLLKPKIGYDGMEQKVITKREIEEVDFNKYILQPLMDFQSEVQFYFLNNELQYALEFKPSKVPVYPDAIKYNYNEKEKQIAQKFANLNKQLIGIQRVDFIKLYNNELKLLEIEDAAPYLDLDELKEKYKDETILLVTHGGTLRAIYWYFHGIPEEGNVGYDMHSNCEIKEYEL